MQTSVNFLSSFDKKGEDTYTFCTCNIHKFKKEDDRRKYLNFNISFSIRHNKYKIVQLWNHITGTRIQTYLWQFRLPYTDLSISIYREDGAVINIFEFESLWPNITFVGIVLCVNLEIYPDTITVWAMHYNNIPNELMTSQWDLEVGITFRIRIPYSVIKILLHDIVEFTEG